MPFASVTKNQWNVINTTSANVVYQNRGESPIFLTSEVTSGLGVDEGYLIQADESVVFGEGLDMKASALRSNGLLFYTVIG